MPAVGSGRSAHGSPSSVRGGEPEELLLDDVGRLAEAALEDRRLLEQRRLDLAVAVAAGEVVGESLEAAQVSRSSGSRSRVPRGARKVGIGRSLGGDGEARRKVREDDARREGDEQADDQGDEPDRGRPGHPDQPEVGADRDQPGQSAGVSPATPRRPIGRTTGRAPRGSSLRSSGIVVPSST